MEVKRQTRRNVPNPCEIDGILFGTVCYIVVKCFVLEERKIYLGSQQYETLFKVVFAFNQDNNYVEPTFNKNASFETFVPEIYDKYDEALEAAQRENGKILDDLLLSIPVKDDFENQIKHKEELFQETLAHFKIVERELLEKTADLKISDDNQYVLKPKKKNY